MTIQVGTTVAFSAAFLDSIGADHTPESCPIRWAELRGVVTEIKSAGPVEIAIVEWSHPHSDDAPRRVLVKNLAIPGPNHRFVRTRRADGRLH